MAITMAMVMCIRSHGPGITVKVNSPAGYVKTAEAPVFHVKPGEDELIIVLVGSDGSDLEETVTDFLKVENGTDSHTLIVGNTPGEVLPNTGGQGTGNFTISGAILL